MQIIPNRVYRHFKGNFYLVVGVAVDASDGGKLYVVYRALHGDCQMFVRPLEEFLSPVDKKKYPNAKQENRFELYEIPNGER